MPWSDDTIRFAAAEPTILSSWMSMTNAWAKTHGSMHWKSKTAGREKYTRSRSKRENKTVQVVPCSMLTICDAIKTDSTLNDFLYYWGNYACKGEIMIKVQYENHANLGVKLFPLWQWIHDQILNATDLYQRKVEKTSVQNSQT